MVFRSREVWLARAEARLRVRGARPQSVKRAGFCLLQF